MGGSKHSTGYNAKYPLQIAADIGHLLTLFFSRKRVTVSRENPWPRSYRILASMLWTDSICFPHRAASRGQRRYHKCTLGLKRVFLFPVIKWWWEPQCYRQLLY